MPRSRMRASNTLSCHSRTRVRPEPAVGPRLARTRWAGPSTGSSGNPVITGGAEVARLRVTGSPPSRGRQIVGSIARGGSYSRHVSRNTLRCHSRESGNPVLTGGAGVARPRVTGSPPSRGRQSFGSIARPVITGGAGVARLRVAGSPPSRGRQAVILDSQTRHS